LRQADRDFYDDRDRDRYRGPRLSLEESILTRLRKDFITIADPVCVYDMAWLTDRKTILRLQLPMTLIILPRALFQITKKQTELKMGFTSFCLIGLFTLCNADIVLLNCLQKSLILHRCL
jgi:hypothetical protein